MSKFFTKSNENNLGVNEPEGNGIGQSAVLLTAQTSFRDSIAKRLILQSWLPVLLATVTFLIYSPSLKSDFVYDARIEILQEGFIVSPSNIPAVLSLKVLGMNLMLGDRPGQMLYLMLIAAVCGKHPFGYHLCSNILHAANVVLLIVLLCRLATTELTGTFRNYDTRVYFAAAVVSLIFALHPISVESVSEVSYSSSLLVTFFTLAALLAATFFDPRNLRIALITGGMGVFCAFASVMSKESGIATALVLVVYWFLFRRQEAKRPWLSFCGAAIAVTAIFLSARFYLAPLASHSINYIGGTFSQMLVIQPYIWVFMIEKVVCPLELSADYTPENVNAHSTSFAIEILIAMLLWQILLAYKSRIGALGVVIYWAGLSTVSNFIPLYHFTADRFYYLPLVGIAAQLFALLLLSLKSRMIFYMVVTFFIAAIAPLILLTLAREAVFTNEASLWDATLKVSPFSPTVVGLRRR